LTGGCTYGIIFPIKPIKAVMETSMLATAVSDPGNGVSQGRPAGRKSFRSCDLNMVAKPLLSEPGSSPVISDAGINLKSYIQIVLDQGVRCAREPGWYRGRKENISRP